MGIHHDDHSGNFLIVIAHAKHLFILSLAKKKGKIKAKLAIKKKEEVIKVFGMLSIVRSRWSVGFRYV